MITSTSRAAQFGTKITSRICRRHLPSFTPTLRHSTNTACDCGRRVKQAVDELRDAHTSSSGTFAAWRRSQYQTSHEESTPTERLVWLAKQSLAASVKPKTYVANAGQAAGASTGQERREYQKAASFSGPTCTWDGPTVWAHLW